MYQYVCKNAKSILVCINMYVRLKGPYQNWKPWWFNDIVSSIFFRRIRVCISSHIVVIYQIIKNKNWNKTKCKNGTFGSNYGGI